LSTRPEEKIHQLVLELIQNADPGDKLLSAVVERLWRSEYQLRKRTKYLPKTVYAKERKQRLKRLEATAAGIERALPQPSGLAQPPAAVLFQIR